MDHARGFARTRFGLEPVSKRRESRLLSAQLHLPRHLLSTVAPEDVLAADWTRPRDFSGGPFGEGPMTINWVVPPANAGSGGHQNIFRFVAHLERRGHTCRIYVHDPREVRTAAMHEQMIRDHFEPLAASIDVLPAAMEPADAIFATSWPTAYPVYVDPSNARRFYFVQDFEPLFYPLGSEYVLAENTYRFGFHGITAGAWLADRLRSDYGMRCDHYEFGADSDLYRFENRGRRNSILFYARPPTPRRAWELGVLTLRLFAEQHPDVEIHMAGWPLRNFKTGFEYTDHGVLRLDELNGLYNQLSGALVLSLTNCSLLPLELLSSGCIPVLNDAPNNRMVVDNDHVRYCPPSPHALARALGEVVTARDATAQAERAASSVGEQRWDTACAHVERVLMEVLRA